MKWLYSFAFLLFIHGSFSQNSEKGKIIILHPSVGNAIDAKEKKQYHLFPEYKDLLFQSAELVKYNDSTYTFLIKTTKAGSFERPAPFEERQQYYNAIENAKPAAITNPVDNTDYYSDKVEKHERSRTNEETSAVVFEVIFDVLSFMFYVLQNYH
jgi:hypothetical protein